MGIKDIWNNIQKRKHDKFLERKQEEVELVNTELDNIIQNNYFDVYYRDENGSEVDVDGERLYYRISSHNFYKAFHSRLFYFVKQNPAQTIALIQWYEDDLAIKRKDEGFTFLPAYFDDRENYMKEAEEDYTVLVDIDNVKNAVATAYDLFYDVGTNHVYYNEALKVDIKEQAGKKLTPEEELTMLNILYPFPAPEANTRVGLEELTEDEELDLVTYYKQPLMTKLKAVATDLFSQSHVAEGMLNEDDPNLKMFEESFKLLEDSVNEYYTKLYGNMSIEEFYEYSLKGYDTLRMDRYIKDLGYNIAEDGVVGLHSTEEITKQLDQGEEREQ